MSTSKTKLNYKQQKIKNILQNEKENDNDLTKKELIDKIRQILDQDYQICQQSKERQLREEELRRVRKLRMDGKITVEEEQYLIQGEVRSYKHDDSKTEVVVFGQPFQRNPTYSYRNRDSKQEKQKEIEEDEKCAKEETEEKEKEGGEEQKKEEEGGEETRGVETDEQGTKENNETEATETNDTENKDVNPNTDECDGKEDNLYIIRQKSEMTLALEKEDDLNKLYELADKMVFISSKK